MCAFIITSSTVSCFHTSDEHHMTPKCRLDQKTFSYIAGVDIHSSDLCLCMCTLTIDCSFVPPIMLLREVWSSHQYGPADKKSPNKSSRLNIHQSIRNPYRKWGLKLWPDNNSYIKVGNDAIRDSRQNYKVLSFTRNEKFVIIVSVLHRNFDLGYLPCWPTTKTILSRVSVIFLL